MSSTETQSLQSTSSDTQSIDQGHELNVVAPPVVEKNSALQYLSSRPTKIENEHDLRLAIERHQGWIASVLNPRAELMEGRANFSGTDLSGFDLSETDLRGVNFSHCTLKDTNFQGSNLNGCNFGHADLQGADLRRATVKRTNFDYANLRASRVQGLDFGGASISHTLMSETSEGIPSDGAAIGQ